MYLHFSAALLWVVSLSTNGRHRPNANFHCYEHAWNSLNNCDQQWKLWMIDWWMVKRWFWRNCLMLCNRCIVRHHMAHFLLILFCFWKLTSRPHGRSLRLSLNWPSRFQTIIKVLAASWLNQLLWVATALTYLRIKFELILLF